MKNDKLMNAFKAFEVKNQEKISGGAVVTCTNGRVCDIKLNSGQMLYDQADPGLSLGQALAEG